MNSFAPKGPAARDPRDVAHSAATGIARAWPWLLLGGGIFGALLLAAGIAWRLMPTRSDYFTDGAEIKTGTRDTTPRDVLWRPPRLLSEVINTGGEVYEPRVAWDGLTVYFVRGKAGGQADIFVTSRTAGGWTDPQPLDAVNTPDADELGPEPSADGQTLYFYSDRPGGQGGYDIWVARRGEDDWQEPTNLGPAVNSGFNEYSPAISPDNKTLYFASNRPQPGDTAQPNPDAWPATIREDIYRRTYDLYGAQLGDAGPAQAIPLAQLNTPSNDGAPCVSPVGDFLYFASDRAGGRGGYDIYRCRLIAGVPQTPEGLDRSINTPANELDPGLAQLGYALYFSSDRPPAGVTVKPDDQRKYAVYYTDAREVFRKSEYAPGARVDWHAIATTLLWLLAGLLLIVLMLIFWGKVRDKRLTLMARCLFGSLLAHCLLMLCFSFWKVTTGLVESMHGSGAVQVSLLPFDGTGELSLQLTGQVVDVSAPDAPDIAITRPESELPADVRTALQETTVAKREIEAEPLKTDTAIGESTPGEISETSITANTPAHPAPSQVAVPQAVQQASAAEAAANTPEIQPAAAIARPEVAAVAPPTDSLRTVAVPRGAERSKTATQIDIHGDPAVADSTPAIGATSATPIAAPTPSGVSTIAAVKLPSNSAPTEGGRAAEAAAPKFAAPLPELTRSSALQTAAGTPLTLREVHAQNSQPRLASEAQIVPQATPTESTGTSVPSPLAPRSAGTTRLASAKPDVALPKLEEAGHSGGASATESVAATPSAAKTVTSTERSLLPLPTASGGARLSEVRPEAAARPTVQAGLAPGIAVGATESDRRAVPVTGATPIAGLAPSRAAGSMLRLPTEIAQPKPALQPATLPPSLAGDPARASAIRAALDWLARHQTADGHWSARDFDATCNSCSGPGSEQFDVGVTALALLSFLNAGQTPESPGPYQQTTKKALGWLVARGGESGELERGETLYSLGMGTFALSQAARVTGSAEVASAARRAAEHLLTLREEQGVWRALSGAAPDTAVLGWQVLALRAAEELGLPAPREAYQAALTWFERVSDRRKPGLFSFRPGDAAAISMTAEGMHTLQLLGIPDDDPRINGAARVLLSSRPAWSHGANTYAWFFAARGLARLEGNTWEPWRGALAVALLDNQEKSGASAGSWRPTGDWASLGGRVFQTALCTLMLETAAGAPQPAYKPIGVIRGVVRDGSSNEPISGATVRLELPDAPAILSETGRDGRYELLVPDVPDFFAIAATHSDYSPASENVSAASLRNRVLELDLRLEPKDSKLVSLEEFPQVHHLGNDRWEGQINSQFQKRSEGLVYHGDFNLTAEQLADAGPRASFTLMVRGVQCPHRVLINGQMLQRFVDRSPEDGSFGRLRVPFATNLLHEGENTLEIHDVDCTGDLDDFEFINLQVRLGR